MPGDRLGEPVGPSEPIDRAAGENRHGYLVAEMTITTDRPRDTAVPDQLTDRRGTCRRGPRRLAATVRVMSILRCCTRLLAISGCMDRLLLAVERLRSYDVSRVPWLSRYIAKLVSLLGRR